MLNVSAAFVEVLENCCQGLHWENTIKAPINPLALASPLSFEFRYCNNSPLKPYHSPTEGSKKYCLNF